MAYMQEVYIADGFADDCDELMHRCLMAGTLTFEIFSDIWKQMEMSCLYHNRSSGAEVAELSEEVLHIAKHYMVADTSNFEESVAGLFLVYSLMNLQPYPDFASLRIVQDDIPAIERIELVARRDRRQDVLYVLGSVLIRGPVQYHAVVRERGMEYPIRKYLEGYSTMDTLGVRPKGVFYRQNTELDIIRELRNLTVRYTTAKENIPDVPRDDRNLNYLDSNFANKLNTSLKNIINGIIHEENDADEDSSTSCDAIKNIKKKAMKAQVKPIRHLIGVDNKSKNPLKPEPKKTTDKTTEQKNNRGKKRKRQYSGSSDSSDDTAKGSGIATADELMSDDDLDINKFSRSVARADLPQDQEFEALEALRGDDAVDVDFIDNLDQPSTSGTQSGNMDTHKRDLKKTILKSRFKRMGMLPVANFVAK